MILTTLRIKQYDISMSVPETYNVPFKYFDLSEIYVELSFEDRDPEELTRGTHYTITDPADAGTLTRVGTWDIEAVRLTIYRQVPITQAAQILMGALYDPTTIERMIDRATAVSQELKEELDRCLKLGITDEPADLVIPPIEIRPRQFATYDADGQLSVAEGMASVPVSEFMADVCAATTGPAAREELDVYNKAEADAVASNEADAAQAAAEATAAAALDAEAHLPPIGIPTFWFTSVLPDWALDCTDGGEWDFATYPELDNEYFKQFLTDFTDFGTTDDDTDFTMPDIQGMFPRVAGVNAVYGTGIYNGGTVGSYAADLLKTHRHYVSPNGGDDGSTAKHNKNNTLSTQSIYASGTYISYTSYVGGNETAPVRFGASIIVRFE